VEFTLVYRGPLKANGKIAEKHAIRKVFHGQLQKLWTQSPLSDLAPPNGYYLEDNPPPGSMSLIQNIGGLRFAPLIADKLHLVAELEITLLRPEAPGHLVTQGGDIDNRLKTLLDALRMPHNSGEIPSGDVRAANENPFSCLLEDDSLITKLAVSTDRLLEPIASQSEVQLFIHVKSRATRMNYGNLMLG
jgi:hypothetical protein